MGKPAKFQTRQQHVEAVQFDGTNECAERIVNWSDEFLTDGGDFPMPRIIVETPEGRFVAVYGDWIIRDSGGFWVCDDETFQRKFEPEAA